MKSFLFFLIVFSFICKAQVSWNPTFNLSNTPGATSDYHSVYSDDFGYYYVVWADNGEIKLKRSQDYGETWFSNITLYSSSNVCGWPVVKADYNYVYVVYHQLAGDYEILFQYSTDFGETWSQIEGISGMDSGSITPQMDLFWNDIYVVWEQKLDMISSINEIYFIKSTDRGATWSVPQNLSNTPTSHSRWVQLESSGNSLYCAWLESTTYPASDIYFSKSIDGGNNWTTPVNITNDARPQNRIYMKISVNDQLYIASDDIITFNFDEIFLLKSSDGGSTWSIPINITNNSGNSNTPCIETWGDNLYFTWADNSHTAPAFDNMDIFFKWSSDEGVTWQDSINLSDNSETSSRPRICYGINGPIGTPWIELTVVWYDYSTGNAEILARRGIQSFVPVELTAFYADILEKNVLLSWIAVTELNNSGFEIQRASFLANPTKDWKKVGFVSGHGTTSEPQAYSFKDENLFSGKYQYRLKQIDLNGSFNYSNEIEVDIDLPPSFSLDQNYPNPFNPATNIQYSVGKRQFVSLKVYDILGTEVAALVNEEKPAGEYKVEFDVSEYKLSSGIYFYKIQAGKFSQTKKLVLMK